MIKCVITVSTLSIWTIVVGDKDKLLLCKNKPIGSKPTRKWATASSTTEKPKCVEHIMTLESESEDWLKPTSLEYFQTDKYTTYCS